MEIDIIKQVEEIMRGGIVKYADQYVVHKSKVELLLGLETQTKCLVLLKIDNVVIGKVKLSSLLGAKFIFQGAVNTFICKTLTKFAKPNDIELAHVFIAISENVNNKILFWLQNGTGKQIKAITEDEILND